MRITANKAQREELIKLLQEKSNLSLRGIAMALSLNRERVRTATLSKDLSPLTLCPLTLESVEALQEDLDIWVASI